MGSWILSFPLILYTMFLQWYFIYQAPVVHVMVLLLRTCCSCYYWVLVAHVIVIIIIEPLLLILLLLLLLCPCCSCYCFIINPLLLMLLLLSPCCSYYCYNYHWALVAHVIVLLSPCCSYCYYIIEPLLLMVLLYYWALVARVIIIEPLLLVLLFIEPLMLMLLLYYRAPVAHVVLLFLFIIKAIAELATAATFCQPCLFLPLPWFFYLYQMTSGYCFTQFLGGYLLSTTCGGFGSWFCFCFLRCLRDACSDRSVPHPRP